MSILLTDIKRPKEEGILIWHDNCRVRVGDKTVILPEGVYNNRQMEILCHGPHIDICENEIRQVEGLEEYTTDFFAKRDGKEITIIYDCRRAHEFISDLLEEYTVH